MFDIEELIGGNRNLIRRRPYLPNLSRIPAKAIDPATGASTWALGSHRWVPYIGILAMKADISMIHINLGYSGKKFMLRENIFTELIFELISIIPIRRGREAVIVYIII